MPEKKILSESNFTGFLGQKMTKEKYKKFLAGVGDQFGPLGLSVKKYQKEPSKLSGEELAELYRVYVSHEMKDHPEAFEYALSEGKKSKDAHVMIDTDAFSDDDVFPEVDDGPENDVGSIADSVPKTAPKKTAPKAKAKPAPKAKTKPAPKAKAKPVPTRTSPAKTGPKAPLGEKTEFMFRGKKSGYICGDNTSARAVLEVLEENPGATREELVTALDKKMKQKKIPSDNVGARLSSIMTGVRQRFRQSTLNINIENNGGKYTMVYKKTA